MSSWLSRLASAAVLLFTVSSVTAQDAAHLVDPFDVRSPSGEYSLHVDPTDPNGWGGAQYTLSRNGTALWSKGFDYTLDEAVVADDGAFAGAGQRRTEANEIELVLVLAGPDGAQRYQLCLPPEPGMMHGSDYPLCAGLLPIPARDCVLFRVIHHRQGLDTSEEWNGVSWTTGKETSVSVPAKNLTETRGIGRFAAAGVIPGTPLIVAHALVLDFDPVVGEMGATFAVFDQDGKPIWQRREAQDYVIQEDKDASLRLWSWVARHGALLPCEEPGRFEFALVQETQRVLCEVLPDPAEPAKWVVKEVERREYELPFDAVEAEGSATYPELGLDPVGTIELPDTAGPVECIRDFDIDDRGRLGAIARAESAPPRFVLREPNGRVVIDLDLQLECLKEHADPQAIWLQGDRWLVHVSEYGEDEARAHAWWLDLPSGALTKIPDFDCAPISNADGTLDGGFVLLTSTLIDNGPVETLSSFDAEGRLRWMDVGANGQRESGLFSPKDVAFNPRGEIGVLDNIKGVIQRFDIEGKLVSEIGLERAAGWKLRYPTNLGVDGEGMWIVCDPLGSVPIVRITQDGQLSSSFAVRYADGRAFRPFGGIGISPDGSQWTSDGFALLRLNALGAVDRIAGDAPSDEQLGTVQKMIIDHAGRILLVDARTQAVHVFDSEGGPLAICRVAPQDMDGVTRLSWLTVDPDLDLYVGPLADEEHRYRKFGPEGKPLGEASFEGINLFQPATDRRWQIPSYQGKVQLFAAEGTALKELSKGQDGRWLELCSQEAVAADGSLVVMARERYHVFRPDGEPVCSRPIPAESRIALLALSGSHVFASGLGRLWRTDLGTGATQCAKLQAAQERALLVPAWREELGELWLGDPIAKAVYRYRVKD